MSDKTTSIPSASKKPYQNGKKLKAVYEGKRKSKSGFESVITHYECEDCTDCPYKKSCTRAKGNRKMQVSKKFIEQRQASLERITSPIGITLRMNRSIQSEGAFGVIKYDYGFQRFLHRGKKKVFTEYLFLLPKIVMTVLRDNTNRRVAITEIAEKGKKSSKPKTKKDTKKTVLPKENQTVAQSDIIVGSVCPLCGKGQIIKGNTAYGCSEWKNGCSYRKPFNS